MEEAAPSPKPGHRTSAGATALDSQQLSAVQADAAEPLIILAPPGSGKTSTICWRMIRFICELEAQPQRILALTFSVRACLDMRRKLQSLGDLFAPIPTASIRVKTFHSWSLATLQYGGFLSNGTSIWSTSQQETAIRLAISAFRQEEGYPPNMCTPSREAAKGFLRRITRLRQRLVGPEQFWAGTEQRDVWVRYIQLKAMNQAIDFDDMLEQIVRYSLDNDQLRAYIRQQFDHVLVDEFQDTNVLQLELVKLLASHPTIVGDDDQAIYQFRGADLHTWRNFRKAYPLAQTVQLALNYRSNCSIVGACNKLIAANSGRLKTMTTQPARTDAPSRITVVECAVLAQEAEYIAEEIKALRSRGVPLSEIAVLYRSNPFSAVTHALELALVGQNIPYVVIRGFEVFSRRIAKDLLAALSLLHNKRDRTAFERLFKRLPGLGAKSWERFALLAHRASSPLETKETSNRSPGESYVDVLLGLTESKAARFGFKRKQWTALVNLQKYLVAWAKFATLAVGTTPLVLRVIQDLGLAEEKSAQRSRCLDIVIACAKDFDRDCLSQIVASSPVALPSATADQSAPLTTPSATAAVLLCNFLAYLQFRGHADCHLPADDGPVPLRPDAVTLSTIHAAKGLEWGAVFGLHLMETVLPSLGVVLDSSLPVSATGDVRVAPKSFNEMVKDAERRHTEEERRLLYVLMSRARDSLYLSYSIEQRYNDDPKEPLLPSRFLSEIADCVSTKKLDAHKTEIAVWERAGRHTQPTLWSVKSWAGVSPPKRKKGTATSAAVVSPANDQSQQSAALGKPAVRAATVKQLLGARSDPKITDFFSRRSVS